MEKAKSKEIKIKRIIIISILVMLVIAVFVFLIYEVFFADILGIFKKNKNQNPIEGNVTYVNETVDNNEMDNTINNQQPNENINISQIDHYYYNQLDDTSKIIYESLENNIENLKTGVYEINFGTQFNSIINQGEEGKTKLNSAFQSAWNAFTYDYVDIFYIDSSKLVLTTNTTTIGELSINEVVLSKAENTNYLTEDVGTSEEVKNRVKYLEDIRTKISAQLNGYTEYEKIKFLHNWMIDKFTYDQSNSNPNAYNVYGAFSTRSVVCEGYSRAFKYILDGLGIESVIVSGTATNSAGVEEPHMWNYVRINEKWYAIDVTWDDPIIADGGTLTEEMRYKYFLKGSNEFLTNHKENGSVTENSTQFIFPVLEKENY